MKQKGEAAYQQLPLLNSFIVVFSQRFSISYSLVYHALHALQSFKHETARHGNVDTDVFLASGFTVHRAAVHEDFSFFQQFVGQFITTHTGCPNIHPDKVCSLQVDDLELREVVSEECFQRQIVLPEIGIELLNSILALVVGRLQGDYAERVYVAHLVDVDGAVNLSAVFRLAGDDIGDL